MCYGPTEVFVTNSGSLSREGLFLAYQMKSLPALKMFDIMVIINRIIIKGNEGVERRALIFKSKQGLGLVPFGLGVDIFWGDGVVRKAIFDIS